MADTGIFERLGNGAYKTAGLGSKEFNKLFNFIAKKQRTRRRKARRQLTKGLLRNKNLEEILKLGKKKDGTLFTSEDLKGFESRRDTIKKTFNPSTAGITYHQLIAHSLPIDVKRANNTVTDGSGVHAAQFLGMKNSTVIVSVTASAVSVHQHHRVEIRLEEWQDSQDNLDANDKKKNKKVIENLCKGRVSLNCDCGRWQYWYRYIGTAGNFALTPPAEYVYPKIRNPRLAGVACKHIIHALTRLQSGVWQGAVAKQLERSVNKVGFGDDKKNTTKFFNEKDIKALMRNRKSQTNQGASRKAWRKYKSDQRALEKKVNRSGDQIEALKAQLQKKGRKVKDLRNSLKARTDENEELQKIITAMKNQIKDGLMVQRQTFIDSQIMAGKTVEEAAQSWLAYFNGKIKGK